MDDPLVSIIMRSFNEGWALRETLPALQTQHYRNWELIVIDSGSTDDSVELLRRAEPRHFIQIQPHEYNPSRVLNCGMDLARSPFGIFLNADATPQGPDWLRPLVQALFEPRTAAVFGRQVPRPDCQAVYACDYERCFGPNRESAHWEHFFSMASSGLRKDVWARRGFDEKFQYSEDDEYTRWCKAQGYRIVYVPESVVAHSHHYTPEQAYQRTFGEGRALAAVTAIAVVWQGRREMFGISWVLLGWLNDLRRDLAFCARARRWREWPHAARIRWQQRRGKRAGFRDGWTARGESRFQNPKPKVQNSMCKPRSIEALDDGLWSLDSDQRFTEDGSEELEGHLRQICDQIRDGVRAAVPAQKLEALLLGGGYGRGEGGVWRTESGDWPYNDLEFYVFLRGSLWLNERRHQASLQALAKRLSAAGAGRLTRSCAGVSPASFGGVPPPIPQPSTGGTPVGLAGGTPAPPTPAAVESLFANA